MKTTFLFLIFTLSTSFIKEENKLKTGFYFLAESENQGELIKDVDSEEYFAVEKNEILTVNDFTQAKLVLIDSKPKRMETIQIKLTKEGKKKWRDIQKRMVKTSESLLFIYNDNVYLEKRILGKRNSTDVTIDLFIGEKYQKMVLEGINSEISASR